MIRDFTATLVSKKQLARQVWGFTFRMPEGEPLEFAAGQYLLLKIEDKYRQYSIASSAHKTGEFELIVEYFPGGLASTFLDGLVEGGAANFKGPAGVFTLRETERPKVFLATGTGIAPVKAMIETYLGRSGGATGLSGPEATPLSLLFGLKTRADIYLYDEFKALAVEHPQFDFDICLSREENLDGLDLEHIAMGRVNEVFDVFLEEETSFDRVGHEFYLCGGKDVVESLKQYVMSLGVPKENIFFENFG
jgi:ferredoxin-NADP reductase